MSAKEEGEEEEGGGDGTEEIPNSNDTVWTSLPLPPTLIERLSSGKREEVPHEENDLSLPSLKTNLSYYFGSGASKRLVLEECSDRSNDRESDIALRVLAAEEDEAKRSKVYILFVVDATGSMDDFARSLEATLTQVLSILNVLFFDAAKLSLFVYTDYGEGQQRLLRCRHDMDLRRILKFVSSLKPQGGGDWAEASKTAFVEVLEYIKRLPSESRSNCVVIHYTDAPPHHKITRQQNLDNAPAEAKALENRRLKWERRARERRNRKSDGRRRNKGAAASETLLVEHHPGYDWIRICHHFHLHGVAVYTITPRKSFRIHRTFPFFALLARASRGKLLVLDNTEPRTITRATMGILLMLMDQPFDRFEHICEVEFEDVREIDRYFGRSLATTENISNRPEDDAESAVSILLNASVATNEPNEEKNDTLDSGDDVHLATKVGGATKECYEENEIPVRTSASSCKKLRLRHFDKLKPASFMKRRHLSTLKRKFNDRNDFRTIVFQALHELVIPENVMSLTYNEILGSLWRLACSRRDDKRLEGLQGMMSRCIQSKRELDDEERAILREWLETSFDYSDEIQTEITCCERDGQRVSGDEPLPNLKANNTAASNMTSSSLDERAASCRFGAFDYFAMSSEVESELPSVRDLRSVMHSPTSRVLKKIQAMLSNIVVFRGDRRERPIDELGRKRYLPCRMPDSRFFRLLPHLVHGGTRFSLKPACIVALLAVMSGHSDLAPKADRFLRHVKGTWLPPVEKIDRPELLSESFINFFANTKNKDLYFTKAERNFYEKVHRIWRLRCAGSMHISIQMPFSPDHHRRIPDEKVLCRRCKTYNSCTLVDVKSETCGLCLWEMKSPKNKWVRPNASSKWYCGRNESFIAQCGTCLSLYAVVGVDDLGISPKCYYCRGGGKRRRRVQNESIAAPVLDAAKPPAVRCTICSNLWLRPGLTEEEARVKSETFVCRPCSKNPETVGGLRSIQIRLADILRANPRLLPMALGFRKGLASVLFPPLAKKSAARVSLFGVVTRHRTLAFGEPRKVHDRAVLASSAVFEFEGKRIGEPSSILCEKIRESVDKRSLTEPCMLCFEDFNVATLRPACGRCHNSCCSSCLRAWYSKNKLGHVFLLAQATCPFCRREPMFEVLREYNREIFDLRHRKESISRMRSRVDYFFAWCTRCNQIQEAIPRQCARGIPKLRGYVCSTCSEVDELRRLEAQRQERIRRYAWLKAPSVAGMYSRLGKRCPGCGHMVVKMEGCDHITCGCGAVWCWLCGHHFKNGIWIYKHGCKARYSSQSAKNERERLKKLKKGFM